MRHDRPGSDLSPNEVATEQSDIERSVVIVRASMLLGSDGTFAGMSADDIRAITCAARGVDVRTRSQDYICGAFDALVERLQPHPRHDTIAR